MKIKKNSTFHYDLVLPSSKSFVNRALILGCLVKGAVRINHITGSSDVHALLRLLEQVGLRIEKESQAYGMDVVIHNSFPECEKRSEDIVELHSGEGGTTNRFLLPLLALGKNRYQLIPDDRLLERPMQSMWETLKKLGVKLITSEGVQSRWPVIQGPMQISEDLLLETSVTTQIASAFAMALVNSSYRVKVKQSEKSSGYFAMTENLIRRFQSGERNFVAPLDFSSLGYLVAYGVHINSIQISGVVALDPYQPDSQLIKIIREWGVEVQFKCHGMVVKPTAIQGFELDCSLFPDLVPTLAFLAAYAQSASQFKSISNLRYKESDRIEALLTLLQQFHVSAYYDENRDILFIEPAAEFTEAVTYISPNDHRLALTAMLFMMKNGGGEIENFECVRKSFAELLNEGAIAPPA